ncbi:hypothetical protein BVG18_08495 [Acinetobacter lwoffii]|nr:hypothetical protein BVG18_08495 [Acinetobacter lwoffii]
MCAKKDKNYDARQNIIADEIRAQNLVENYLKDPDSAKFRNMNGKCGEVNSKNSFGAYTGYKRFFATQSLVIIDDVNEDRSTFEKIWNDMCR